SRSVLPFLRRGRAEADVVLVVGNFTPGPRPGYAVGVPRPGRWKVVLNTDAAAWGGSGLAIAARAEASAEPAHGRPWRLTLTLPPVAGPVPQTRPGETGRPAMTTRRLTRGVLLAGLLVLTGLRPLASPGRVAEPKPGVSAPSAGRKAPSGPAPARLAALTEPAL